MLREEKKERKKKIILAFIVTEIYFAGAKLV